MPPQLLPAAGPDFSSTPPPAPRRSDIALPRDTPRPTRAAPAKPVVPAGDPTVEDLIRQEADKAGVPHELALAVAEQESGFDPTRTNPVAVNGEHATGTFQLLPSTAKRLGVDPHNPVENIHGGVAYLRELLDEHQGDLPKVLSAYGGVKTNQTYVPEVLARLPKFAAASTTGAAPAASAGTPPPAPPETWGQWGVRHGKQVLSAFDPRTAEGRQNLAGATGAGLATGAMVATAPASVPIVGLTAATAGILG